MNLRTMQHQQSVIALAKAMRASPALRKQVEEQLAKRRSAEIEALAKSEAIALTMRAERRQRKAAAWAKRQGAT